MIKESKWEGGWLACLASIDHPSTTTTTTELDLNNEYISTFRDFDTNPWRGRVTADVWGESFMTATSDIYIYMYVCTCFLYLETEPFIYTSNNNRFRNDNFIFNTQR